jgi:hypothetical protein
MLAVVVVSMVMTMDMRIWSIGNRYNSRCGSSSNASHTSWDFSWDDHEWESINFNLLFSQYVIDMYVETKNFGEGFHFKPSLVFGIVAKLKQSTARHNHFMHE